MQKSSSQNTQSQSGAGKTWWILDCYSSYLPYDIVETGLCCYKIDVLLELVGNQRGMLMD